MLLVDGVGIIQKFENITSNFKCGGFSQQKTITADHRVGRYHQTC